MAINYKNCFVAAPTRASSLPASWVLPMTAVIDLDYNNGGCYCDGIKFVCKQ